MHRVLLGLVTLAAVPFALYACGSDDPAAPGPKAESDAAAVPETGAADTSTSTPDTGVVDAGVQVGKCSQASFDAPAGANGGDFTAQTNVDVTFPTGVSPAQYTNRCAKVKAGSTVTFKGSFVNHPLQPSGGDAPTPIVLTNMDPDGGSLVVPMPTKGTYGYDCAFHPSLMFGAIQVVP